MKRSAERAGVHRPEEDDVLPRPVVRPVACPVVCPLLSLPPETFKVIPADGATLGDCRLEPESRRVKGPTEAFAEVLRLP